MTSQLLTFSDILFVSECMFVFILWQSYISAAQRCTKAVAPQQKTHIKSIKIFNSLSQFHSKINIKNSTENKKVRNMRKELEAKDQVIEGLR